MNTPYTAPISHPDFFLQRAVLFVYLISNKGCSELGRGTQAFETPSPAPCCNTGQQEQGQPPAVCLEEVLGRSLIAGVHLCLLNGQFPGQNAEGEGSCLTALMTRCSAENSSALNLCLKLNFLEARNYKAPQVHSSERGS